MRSLSIPHIRWLIGGVLAIGAALLFWWASQNPNTAEMATGGIQQPDIPEIDVGDYSPEELAAVIATTAQGIRWDVCFGVGEQVAARHVD